MWPIVGAFVFDLIQSNVIASSDKSLNCWKVGCVIKATWSILKLRVLYVR